MGGVCSKSSTKKKKESKNDTASGKEAAPPQQLSAPVARSNSDPHYPVVDLADDDGVRAAPVPSAAAAAPADMESTFTLSTTRDESKGAADSAAGAPPGSPNKLNDTKQPLHTATGNRAACPPPAQKGENYAQWFPPEHDAGMKLGDGKYNGVGVQSPSSEAPSAELHSLASTPNYRIPSPVASSPGLPPPPPSTGVRPHQPQPRPYDPMRFVDEDSAAPETASSAFVTPRELRDDASSSVAGFADNISLVSHGSMMSQHPHGYRYYNSNNTTIDDSFPTPMSRRPSVGSASLASAAAASGDAARPLLTQRSTKSAITVTNVRNNRQMPAGASVGHPTPLSRQSSRAASDRFQSCRSIGDASPSAASYLPPTSPAGGVTEADVLLLSAQPGSNYSGNRRGSFGSLRSAYQPSTPGGGPMVFYSCRSFNTASEQSSALSPASGQPLLSSALRGMALPPRSPRGSPMTMLSGTPTAQQDFLHRQASRQSVYGDAQASDAFFSVRGSSQDVFLDLPSAAEASTVYTLDDDCDLELTLGARERVKDSLEPASPASHYSSSVGVAAAAAAPAPATGSAGPLDSPNSSAASSTWLAAPAAIAATKVPGQRQRRATAPPVDAVANESEGGASSPAVAAAGAGLDASASDYDADRSSVATNGPDVKGKRSRKPVPAKPYYTKADFPANPHTPPQAQALKANASPLAPPKKAAAATAARTAGALQPLTVVEATVMDATYVTLSTPSETSTRKSGATRPTLRYPDTHTTAEEEEGREVDGDESGDAVRPRALAHVVAVVQPAAPPSAATAEPQQQPHNTLPTASSTNSFSTVASSYRREQQQHERAARKSVSSLDALQGDMEKAKRTTATATQQQPRRRSLVRSKAQTAKPKPRGKAAAAADPTVPAPAPLMTNPNPWVPGGTTAATESAHVDPYVVDEEGQAHPREHSSGATPASATTPRTPNRGRGRPVRRSVTPAATAATGRAYVAPGRRVPAAAVGRTSKQQQPHHQHNHSPPATAATAATTMAPQAEHITPVPEEAPRWSSLTPSQETSSSAKPIAKLAVAAKARKMKKSAAAATAATPDADAPAAALVVASSSQTSLPPTPAPAVEGVDSVVEYELFTGELADVDADSTTEDTAVGSPVAPQQQRQQDALPQASHTSPQLRLEHRREGGFRASPEASPTILTSAETSGFMQPFSEAQLAAETEQANGEWTAATLAGVATPQDKSDAAAAVLTMRAAGAEARRLSDENDEGYDADSGMPAAHVGASLKAPPPPQPPRSVSATSTDDGIVGGGNSERSTLGGETAANRSAPQVNGVGASAAKEGGVMVAGGESAVVLSSSSSVSEADISVASPVVVG